MLSKLAVRRLTKLADFMDALPRSANKHFDMGTWFGHDDTLHTHELGKGDLTKSHLIEPCGTRACAMGWAATVPAFKKAGLSFDLGARYFILNGERLDGSEAAESFFELSERGYFSLFSSDLIGHITTPKQWAKHCRKFIKANT